jgi:RecA/RadA recombinase
MVKVIMGVKGSGKTKLLIDLVRKALSEETGHVVVIEKERSLTYDIPYKARLIVAADYDFGSAEFFKGFISAIHAGNYDTTHIFIDNLYKMFADKSIQAAEEFLAWLDAFSVKEKVNFTLTLSAPIETATENIKKYF